MQVFKSKFLLIGFVLIMLALNILTPFSVYASNTLPQNYDLRQSISFKTVNQEGTALCWAFASNRVVETFMEKNFNKKMDLSETWASLAYANYIQDSNIEKSYNTSPNFDLQNYTFGNSASFKNYENAMNAYGFASEYNVPFSIKNEITNENLTEKFNYYHQFSSSNLISDIEFDWCGYYNQETQTGEVEEAQIILNMKDYLYNYGAIYLQSRFVLSSFGDINYLEFRAPNASVNHALTIIGYDDNITVTKTVVENDTNVTKTFQGAFILANSYGDNNEFVYMLYGDSNHLAGCYYIKSLYYNSLKYTLADINKNTTTFLIDSNKLAPYFAIALCFCMAGFSITLIVVYNKMYLLSRAQANKVKIIDKTKE